MQMLEHQGLKDYSLGMSWLAVLTMFVVFCIWSGGQHPWFQAILLQSEEV